MKSLLILAALASAAVAHGASANFQERFDHQIEPSFWRLSDGWSNGSAWLNDWRKSQVRVGPTGMLVTLDRNPASKGGYSSGEIQSVGFFRYGYFETRMTPAAGSGVVTGFFTYTGPSRGMTWNEVDVEFLGKDTHRVQFTYHVGDKQHAFSQPLPFDAAYGAHTYAFDWQPGFIHWYVDGALVHSDTGAELPLPTEPQQIMFDLWGSNAMASWMGPFAWPGHPIAARVRCIAHSDTLPGAQLC